MASALNAVDGIEGAVCSSDKNDGETGEHLGAASGAVCNAHAAIMREIEGVDASISCDGWGNQHWKFNTEEARAVRVSLSSALFLCLVLRLRFVCMFIMHVHMLICLYTCHNPPLTPSMLHCVPPPGPRVAHHAHTVAYAHTPSPSPRVPPSGPRVAHHAHTLTYAHTHMHTVTAVTTHAYIILSTFIYLTTACDAAMGWAPMMSRSCAKRRAPNLQQQ